MIFIENNVYHKSCPLCGSPGIEPVGPIQYVVPVKFSTTSITLKNQPELYKCLHCGSRFTQYSIPEETAVQLYTNGASNERWKAESFRAMKEPQVVDTLLDVFVRRSHVLDVGCNTGQLLDLAKEKDCVTYGVELSLESQKTLTEKGHKVYNDLAELKDTSLDVITAFDLAEHLYHISAFLALCSAKLKDGGKLVIFTGNVHSKSARWAKANWWYLKYPEHVVFPSVRFFELAGFNIERKIATYASLGYKKGAYAAVRALAAGVVKGTYTGLPSFGPDHFMVILKK